MKSLEFAFEINWPLALAEIESVRIAQKTIFNEFGIAGNRQYSLLS